MSRLVPGVGSGTLDAAASPAARPSTGVFPVSASANSRALANRSAGSFSSACSTARSTCSGTFGRLTRTLRGRSVSSLAISDCDVLAT